MQPQVNLVVASSASETRRHHIRPKMGKANARQGQGKMDATAAAEPEGAERAWVEDRRPWITFKAALEGGKRRYRY